MTNNTSTPKNLGSEESDGQIPGANIDPKLASSATSGNHLWTNVSSTAVLLYQNTPGSVPEGPDVGLLLWEHGISVLRATIAKGYFDSCRCL